LLFISTITITIITTTLTRPPLLLLGLLLLLYYPVLEIPLVNTKIKNS